MKWADTAPTLAWDAVTSPRLGFRVDSGQDEHSIVAAGFKSLFQKSPLKNRAGHGATNYDINPPIST